MTATADVERPSAGVRRRFAGLLHRRPSLRLGGLLAAPLGWLVLIYLGSLVVLFLNAFWQRDEFTGS